MPKPDDRGAARHCHPQHIIAALNAGQNGGNRIVELPVAFTPIEQERLLIAIESSLDVHRRHQYFLWTQGVIQSFLPHDLLVYGHGEYGSPAFRWEILAAAGGADEQGWHREIGRLVDMAVAAWRDAGCVPQVYDAASRRERGSLAAICDIMARLDFGYALAHGTREFAGDAFAFFVFLRMPDPPGVRQTYFADMFMPYLHTALRRMLHNERGGNSVGRPLSDDVRLSQREQEVVALIREGKTNQQIAAALHLSPLTIKNHVQNILRKLGVSNRAQAAAQAVKLQFATEGGR